jgi:hypothetical protein
LLDAWLCIQQTVQLQLSSEPVCQGKSIFIFIQIYSNQIFYITLDIQSVLLTSSLF